VVKHKSADVGRPNKKYHNKIVKPKLYIYSKQYDRLQLLLAKVNLCNKIDGVAMVTAFRYL